MFSTSTCSFRAHSRPAAGTALTIAVALLVLTAPARAITGSIATASFAAVSSGVQITADWVVTARHVVVGAGASYANGYGERSVAASYALPGEFPNDDLALMRLAPLATPSAVPLLAVSADLIVDGSFAPLAVTIASSANSTGPRAYAYTTLSEADSSLDPDGPGPKTPVRVNYLISLDSSVHVQGGDSGGALFAGQVTDSGVLLGITSALLEDNQKRPVGSAFVQLAAYRGWIDATMAADLADNEAVLWATAVPEPATWLLYLAGLGSLRFIRRRRAREPVRPS
jgi:hypothetical protein